LSPEKGLSGTTSFNITTHGTVTILVYEGATEINESTDTIDNAEEDELCSLTMNAFNSYVSQAAYDHIKQHLNHGVSRKRKRGCK